MAATVNVPISFSRGGEKSFHCGIEDFTHGSLAPFLLSSCS
jgi:hypothetical protein